jgi:hypothetical protein
VTFICVPGKRETVERIGTFCFVIKNVRKTVVPEFELLRNDGEKVLEK